MARKASSNSKRRARHGREKTKEEVDRISLLPDDILCHILSSLPTKDAVGLSILSKRWRYAWTSVPIINIVNDHYLLSETPEMKGRFMDFVDRVLGLNDACFLREFGLNCNNDYDSSRVSSWVSAVINRDIENLDIAILGNDDPLYLAELPLNMFTCKKLVKLKLFGDISLNVFPAVYLPCLKVLHLFGLQSLDDNSVKNLLAGCPVLEELSMDRRGDKLNTWFVQSSSLKNLYLSTTYGDGDYYDIPIVIDAINLEVIYLQICVPQQFEAKRLSSLVKVDLELCNCDPETVGMDVYGDKVVELLRQISNTKHLFLSLEAMEALGYTCLDNLPMFHNLTHLKMQMYSVGWPILPYLLECLPKLISFILKKETAYEENECHQQFHTPKCSMLYLEKIELDEFQGDGDEIKMVRYFLKNSPVLKKMSIEYYYSLSTIQKSKVCDKIFMLPKGSTDVEIEFL